MTEGNVQFKKYKTCDFVFKKKRSEKEERKKQGGVFCSQIKTTFGNLLKEAYLHLYEDWVGREKRLDFIQPLNCQISLESSLSYMSRVNSFPFVAKSQPLVPPNKYSRGSSYHLGTGFPKGVIRITNGLSHLASKCNLWLIPRQNNQV